VFEGDGGVGEAEDLGEVELTRIVVR